MAWYDWVLWLGVLYMGIGSDFSLSWLTGVVSGKRIDKNSKNRFNRLYYYIWASTDPLSGPIDPSQVDDSGTTAPINKKPLQPGIVSLCHINGIITVLLEIIILIGMFTHGPYLRPAVFIFIFRGLLEFAYGAQLCFGRPGLKGWPLINYLVIGLIPQTLVPFFLALRFATSTDIHILWWQPWAFVVLPYAVFVWTVIIAKKNQPQL